MLQNCIWFFALYVYFITDLNEMIKINQPWLEIAELSFKLFCAYAICKEVHNTSTNVQNKIFIELPTLKLPV